jgi:hypothetical protein
VRLSIVTLGHVHAEDLTALTQHFEGLEQLVLDIPPRSSLADHRAELNRAIDAAGADWILIIRERETIDEDLAREIAEACSRAHARGFRIRSCAWYAGHPLHIGETNEIRLFHRRHYIRYAAKGEWRELSIQGTVVRMNGFLRSVTFVTPQEHEDQLRASAAPHSVLRRVLLFIRYAIGARTFDRNTLRYLWIEAGFDVAPA